MTARALVLEAPRTLVERTLDVPDVGDDDAVLRVDACGLCGTDHEQFTALLPGPMPFVPGHETVGTIDRIGPAAASRWGVAEGDRVAVEVFQSCRECDATQRCARHGLGDMYGFVSVDTKPGLWGGYATHQYLAPDSMVLKVPSSLDPVTATLFNPLSAGVRWGVTVPGTKAGDVVAILGPGIRGISALAAVRDVGASFVMVTGAGERDAPRLEMARRFGADLTVDVTVDDPLKALRTGTGGSLADVVLDVTAKAPSAFGQAVRLARQGGTVVVAGTRGSEDTPGFAPDHVVYKELRILGALGVDTASYETALTMLASGKHPWDQLPRVVAGLGELPSLLELLAGEREGVPPVHGVLAP